MKTVTTKKFAPMFEAAVRKYGDKVLGAAVSWDFGDGDCDAVQLPRDNVRQAFADNGFDPALIIDPDPAECMRRSRAQFYKKGGHVVREIPKKHKDSPIVFGIYLRDAQEGEGGDKFLPGARMRVNHDTGRVVCLAPEGGDFIASCKEVGDRFTERANMLLNNVVNKDVSDALLRCAFQCGAFKERFNKGGTYYLPTSDNAKRFIRLLDALAALTQGKPFAEQFHPHVTVQFAEPCTEATWQNSAAYSMEKELQGLMKDLAKIKKDGMRTSSIEARADQVKGLLDRAKMYASILGDVQKELVKGIKHAEQEYGAVLNGSSGLQMDALADMAGKASKKKASKPGKRASKAAPKKRTRKVAATSSKKAAKAAAGKSEGKGISALDL